MSLTKVSYSMVTGSPLNVMDFGAVGDGVTDDTSAIQAALTAAGADNKRLYFPNGSYAVNTFGVTMDGTTLCAFRVNADLSLVGPGVITSSTSAVSNSIFGIDATSGTVSLSIDGLGFAGNVRYRAVYAETGATMDTVDIRNVVTARQSFIFGCTVVRSIRVSDNKIGNEIESVTAVSPTLTVALPQNPTYNPECAIERNVVRTGTEVSSTGAYVIHGLPMGGRCNYNTHLNVGAASGTEGFDIDNVGRFAQIIGNASYGSGFEYKVGTGGYSDSRDIIFANNISVDADVPFSIRSSCIGYGNIAYNPQSYGLFCTPGSDVDSLLDDATFQLHGFRIIYAGGTPWTAAVKIDGGMAGMEFDGIRIELDPAWKTANPSGTLPNIQFNVDGDINNLTIRNCFIDKSAGDQINVRPSTRISNLNIENVQFGDCGDSCIDLLDCDAVRIINPVFPATITDRPIRLTTCDRVRIECDYHANITLAQTSGGSTGVLINNYGQEAAGAATPPNATARWPVGCVVLNTSDSSVWLRISTSATPATAWKQIA